MDDRRVNVTPDGRAVVAENGPLRLVIQAFTGGTAQLELAWEAAHYGFECLQQVAAERRLLSLPFHQLTSIPVGVAAAQMVASVRRVGDPDLTPMAAVAGTIADCVADWLASRGPDKVIVDNGGDISIRLSGDQTATVGLRPVVDSPDVSHVVRLRETTGGWGVATSGLGGRSLTRGVASAVTVFADTASAADAAATAIANSSSVDDPAVIRRPANTVDPATDLGDLPVTVAVGRLDERSVLAALAAGLNKAERLVRRGIVSGAFLVVQDRFASTATFNQSVSALEPYRGAPPRT